MRSTDALTTGEIAQRAGVNRETIRFYERNGLLPEPPRTPSGYRLYQNADVRRVLFVKRAQSLGFSLHEVAELLAIADGRMVRCRDVRRVAEKRLTYVDKQIIDLKKLRHSLRDLVSKCDEAAKINGCPIIDVLSQGERRDAH